MKIADKMNRKLKVRSFMRCKSCWCTGFTWCYQTSFPEMNSTVKCVTGKDDEVECAMAQLFSSPFGCKLLEMLQHFHIHINEAMFSLDAFRIDLIK